jgi:prepilin peptidase CpaA
LAETAEIRIEMELSLIKVAGFGLLALLLAVAVWHDLASRRIPNAIVVAGIATAFLYSLMGGIRPSDVLAGFGVGLAAMLPLYLLRAAGAGDAKLMGMVGAFLGPLWALGAVLMTFLIGALLAMATSARRRTLRKLGLNLRIIAHAGLARLSGVEGPSFDPRNDSAGTLPYSVAIALGSTSFVAWRLAA